MRRLIESEHRGQCSRGDTAKGGWPHAPGVIQPKSVGLAVGGVGALLAFLIAFFTLSDRLGGWPWGFVTTSAITLAVFLVVASGASTALSGGPTQASAPTGAGEPTIGKVSKTARKGTQVLYNTTVHVEALKSAELELDVRKGDVVEGNLGEKDDQDFHWWIVTERNLVKLRGKEEFNYEKGEENTVSALVKWKVPRDTYWYLVLSAERMWYDRKVSVYLRRRG